MTRARKKALDPGLVTRLLDEAAQSYAAGRFSDAARLYARVERHDPADDRAVYSLAVIDLRRGETRAARRRLAQVAERQPNLFEAQHNLGAACQTLGLWDEAADAYRRARALRPGAAETGFNLAIALAVLGRTAEAIDVYRALAKDPACSVRALSRIALLDAGLIGDDDLALLWTGADDAAAAAAVRTAALFALGEALEFQGRDDEAFAAFDAGNRRKVQDLAEAGADPAAIAAQHADDAARVRRIFTPDFLTAHAGGGDQGDAPIFVVGMPRSGSTLIEQILASHPQVTGLGESGALAGVLDGAFPHDPAAPVHRDHFRRLARAYLAAQRARGGDARFVDKTLENHLHVGMIHLMFPRAVILHAVRDPVETCLACWRQLFAAGNETLYDLAQIGAAYRRYRQVMDHWNTVLPCRVVKVEYEALVERPQAQIPWLVTQACGLDWDPACLAFHKTGRPVSTASAAQVRRPLFRTSLDRRSRYGAHLAPLLAALDSES